MCLAVQFPRRWTRYPKHFSDASSDRLDGLRLDWPGKWLLIRASNTEPIVRIVAETPTAAESQSLCARSCPGDRQREPAE